MSIEIKGMTNSYNSNSCPQMHAIELSIPFIQRAIEVLDLSSLPSTQLLIIADFGSSHGLNSMYAMKIIIEYLKTSKNKQRSILVIHNDLPTNNWTILFDLLNKDNSYFRTDTFTRFQQGKLALDVFLKDQARFLRNWAEPSLRETLERNNHRLKEEVETLLDEF
ncbi:unnamed protein product [Rotaria sp. Silwood2]|nr:unnamed protein product [Rotaria sp. Silwood2]CAF4411768.1 unnamed protein product [Rotaria sp. Silwood2]